MVGVTSLQRLGSSSLFFLEVPRLVSTEIVGNGRKGRARRSGPSSTALGTSVWVKRSRSEVPAMIYGLSDPALGAPARKGRGCTWATDAGGGGPRAGCTYGPGGSPPPLRLFKRALLTRGLGCTEAFPLTPRPEPLGVTRRNVPPESEAGVQAWGLGVGAQYKGCGARGGGRRGSLPASLRRRRADGGRLPDPG